MPNKFKILGIIAIVVAINPQGALAYLDPGTGSMIIQVIIASIVGAGCTIGVYKKKISDFFKNIGHHSEK